MIFIFDLKELKTNLGELSEISQYHFDGGGKYFRPLIIMLMARACNVDNRSVSKLSMNCFESSLFILYMKILNLKIISINALSKIIITISTNFSNDLLSE